MRPNALELLEVLDENFTTQVQPALTDPYLVARSAVMSQIIGHVYQRVAHEGPLLWDDNAELAELLEHLAGTPLVRREQLAAVAPLDPSRYPSTEELTRRNCALKSLLVDAINALDAQENEVRATVEPVINAYLRRQLDREVLLTSAPANGAHRELPKV
jgi:hypothetical protein